MLTTFLFTILFFIASLMAAFTLFILLNLLYGKPKAESGTAATAEEIEQLLAEGRQSFSATIGGLYSCSN